MKNLITICLLITAVLTSQAQEKKVEDCDCPKPDKTDFRVLCNSLNAREPGREGGKFSEKYQEDLWEMSCADLDKDTMETAKLKIQKMWNENRVEFRCLGFSGGAVKDANVAKFSMMQDFQVSSLWRQKDMI